MTQCASTTMDIDSIVSEFVLNHRGHGYGREGLVDFPKIDFTTFPSRFIQHFLNCACRSCGEPLRLVSMGGVSNDAGDRLQPFLGGGGSFH